MGQQIAGYELPEGTSITDLDLWPPFAEWFKEEYGCDPVPEAHQDTELFEAWMAGAYWQAQKSIELRVESERRLDV